VRDWQICASLDGTGATGEYIRTGLDFDQWCRNFALGLDISTHARQMRIDFTLTLPGLFEVINIQELAQKFGVDVLAKVVFGFTPDVVMSPLALPRTLLHQKIDGMVADTKGALRAVLLQLKQRPTFEEQWPNEYAQALSKGKQRILRLEQIRNDRFTMSDILKQDKEINDWWHNIR
jgi:hypothetical protein